MTALKTEKHQNIIKHNIFKEYSWFYTNLYLTLKKLLVDFYEKEYQLRLISITYDENILFYGDEYFVNKIPVNNNLDIKIKISSKLISSFLDNALGEKEEVFKLQNLTDIEAMLIKAFTLNIYKTFENQIIKTEPPKKILGEIKNINVTFYVKTGTQHFGKIIISLPEYILPEKKEENIKENFSISSFKTAYADVRIGIGKTKLTLTDVKAMEEGDIIVLENSDINKMYIILGDKEINFKITPNPSLIISIENNGDNEMEEETSVKPQNMWDSILVDVVAEFDNVKLTLGELKQISEGLVIDVGSVYDNKIKLRVENQVVATGELVILNDRYGVRIEEIKKSKESTTQNTTAQSPASGQIKKEAENNVKSNTAAPKQANAPQNKPQNSPVPKTATPQDKEDKNFDYSDFEIEDESI